MTQLTLHSLQLGWGGPGHLPLAGSLRVLLQLMSELRQLHEGQGHAHGELTPELIALTDDSRVRLLAPTHPFLPNGAAARFPLRYLAPEKLRGEAIGERADVFSVGVLLWEALAGKPLLELSAPEDILARWRADIAPLAPVRDPHLWARSLSHIAARALAIEPVQRYPNIRQFHNALETLAGRHAANLDAWEAILRGPPRASPKALPAPRKSGAIGSTLARIQSDAELEQLPDLSHLTGDAPRVRPFQSNSDDTIFDITARPPDLEEEADEDELPTRFMPSPRPPSVAPSPAPPAAVTRQATRPKPAAVARHATQPKPATRPAVRRAPRPETAENPARSTAPARSHTRAWLLVVLVAAILGAVSSQLTQPSHPARSPTSAH